MNNWPLRVLKIQIFIIVSLGVSACSPYVYEKEIALFREAVDNSVASYEELVRGRNEQDRQRLIAERDEELKQQSEPITFTEGCHKIWLQYEKGFAEKAKNVLTETDYQSCDVNPPYELKFNALHSNLTIVAHKLKGYAVGLGAVSNAEDATQLKSAVTELNTNAKELLVAVNQELGERGEEQFDAIAGLVYQIGITVLNQRRFNMLKSAVNEAQPFVKRAAELLSEAVFDMQGPMLSNQYRTLLSLETNKTNETENNYIKAWKALKSETDTFVGILRSSPVSAFQKLVDTHATLQRSVNDHNNQKQIEQVLVNVREFNNAAKTSLSFLKRQQDDDGSEGKT